MKRQNSEPDVSNKKQHVEENPSLVMDIDKVNNPSVVVEELDVAYYDTDTGAVITVSDIIHGKMGGIHPRHNPKYRSIKDIVAKNIPVMPKPNIPRNSRLVNQEVQRILAGNLSFSNDMLAVPGVVNESEQSREIVSQWPKAENLKSSFGVMTLQQRNMSKEYYQIRFNSNAWSKIFDYSARFLTQVKQQSEVIYNKAVTHYNYMRTVAQKYCYGTGLNTGQLSRLSKCAELHKFAIEQESKYGTNGYSTYIEMASAWDRTWALGPVPEGVSLDTSTLVIMSEPKTFVDHHGIDRVWYPIRVARNSEEGLPFINPVSRNDALMGEISVNAEIWSMASTMQTKDLIDNTKPATYAKMKAKAEVYEISKLPVKTRSIFVHTAAAMYPGNCLVRALKYAKLGDTHPISSLSKMTFLRKGLHKLIMKILNSEVTTLVYADNVYLFQVTESGVRSESIDGQKMESSHTSLKEVIWNIDYMIERMFEANPTEYTRDQENVDVNTLIQLREVVSRSVINTQVLFEKFTMEFPGMTSGGPLTFVMNDTKSRAALGHASMSDLVRPLDNTPYNTIPTWLIECFGRAGVKLDLDRDINPTIPGMITLDKIRPYDLDKKIEGNLCRADILGFSVGAIKLASEDERYYVPVLDYERLMKSLVFRKRSGEKKNVTQDLIDLMTMNTLYIMGGWYYVGLNDMIQAVSRQLATDALQNIEESAEMDISLESALDTLMSVLPENSVSIAKSILQGLTNLDVPCLYTVFELLIGEDEADSFRQYVVDNIEDVRLITSYLPTGMAYEYLTEKGYDKESTLMKNLHKRMMLLDVSLSKLAPGIGDELQPNTQPITTEMSTDYYSKRTIELPSRHHAELGELSTYEQNQVAIHMLASMPQTESRIELINDLSNGRTDVRFVPE